LQTDEWIPAFAGMTAERAGMTAERAGATAERAGATAERAGAKAERAGMTAKRKEHGSLYFKIEIFKAWIPY